MRPPKGLFTVLLVAAAILAGCASRQPQAPQLPVQQRTGYMDAVELKQKCQEMATQLLANVPEGSLKGYVAMPTSFVNENNTSVSSPLGRLLAESMYYEFTQRGVPTREYRLTGNIATRGGMNDIALAANRTVPTKNRKNAVLLVGTYLPEKDAVFVNARLARASDGLVLGASELVLPGNALILGMARDGAGSGTTSGGAFISSQSAPVLSPSYPSLAGSVIQSATAGIPIVQGK